MSEAGEACSGMSDIKRQKLQPERIAYAKKKLAHLDIEQQAERIIIKLSEGTVTFWPYTGWFQGQNPYGKTKGRGIKKLLKSLKEIS